MVDGTHVYGDVPSPPSNYSHPLSNKCITQSTHNRNFNVEEKKQKSVILHSHNHNHKP